jgi:hypothetical protein
MQREVQAVGVGRRLGEEAGEGVRLILREELGEVEVVVGQTAPLGEAGEVEELTEHRSCGEAQVAAAAVQQQQVLEDEQLEAEAEVQKSEQRALLDSAVVREEAGVPLEVRETSTAGAFRRRVLK